MSKDEDNRKSRKSQLRMRGRVIEFCLQTFVLSHPSLSPCRMRESSEIN